MVQYIFISALIDAEHLKDNDYIESHVSRTILRGTVAFLYGVIAIPYAIIFLLLFWLLFDTFLNKLLDREILYLGNTAKTDKFFRKRPLLYILTKLFSLVLAVYIFLNYIK